MRRILNQALIIYECENFNDPSILVWSYESNINAEVNSRNILSLFVTTQILATPLKLLCTHRIHVPKEPSCKGSCHTYEDRPSLVHRDNATGAPAPPP